MSTPSIFPASSLLGGVTFTNPATHYLAKPASCFDCALHKAGSTGWSRLEGDGSYGVMIIPEALGEHEAKDGLPLRPHAPSGAIFQTMIDRRGLQRHRFTIANVVRCRPPNNSLDSLEGEIGMEYCSELHLKAAIRERQPKMLVAMGGTALKLLTKLEGSKLSITNIRGFILHTSWEGAGRIPVIATYHPSYISRDKPNLLNVFGLDIQRAVRFAREGWTRRRVEYQVPSAEEFEGFVRLVEAHPELPITYDIETSESPFADESEIFGMDDGRVRIVQPMDGDAADHPDVLRAMAGEEVEDEEGSPIALKETIIADSMISQIQFTLGIPNSGGLCATVVVPWAPSFTPLIGRVLKASNKKAGWNSWGFDDKLLRAHGCELGGELHDLMWMFHRYQPDLPRGLQFAASWFLPEGEPWKHLAGRHTTRGVDDFYGAKDVYEPAEFWPAIESELRRYGAWRSYYDHCYRVGKVMRRMSQRGIPVDAERHREFGEAVEKSRRESFDELQAMFPMVLRGVSPEKGYKNPSIAEKLIEAAVEEEKENMGLEPGEFWDMRKFWIPRPEEKPSKRPKYALVAEWPDWIEPDWEVNERGEVAVWRWCRVQPFLYNSSQQVIAYIEYKREEEIREKIEGYRKNKRYAELDDKALRAMAVRNCLYEVPWDRKKGKPTTAKKELERLVKKTKDIIIPKSIECREYNKILATYHKGWTPNPRTGRVHPEVTFAPSTGQKSMRRPNAQNVPK